MASNTQNIMHLCWISIQSEDHTSCRLSVFNLKNLEDYIRKEARQIGGFDENSFNIKFNLNHKKYQCFVNFSSSIEVEMAVKLFHNKKIHGSYLRCENRKPGQPSASNGVRMKLQHNE